MASLSNWVLASIVSTLLPFSNNTFSRNLKFIPLDFNLSTISSTGIFYYRIKEIDKNGKFIYSETRKIRLSGKALAILAYPNPINHFVNLTIDIEEDASGILTIYDAVGKKIQLMQLELLKGANTKKINMANLAAGSYLIQLTTPKENKIIRIIKLTN